MKLRLPFRVRAAVNSYFAVKYFYGGTFPSQVEKDEVLSCLDRETKLAGMSFVVVPGVIIITRGDVVMHINSPVIL